MPKRLQQCLHACLTFVFIASLLLVQPGMAAAPTPQIGTPDPDDIRFGYNAETGKLSFVGGEPGTPLIRKGEVGALSVEAAGMTIIRRYAGQFGLQDPTRNLRLERDAGGSDRIYPALPAAVPRCASGGRRNAGQHRRGRQCTVAKWRDITRPCTGFG
jgi:hypothetical protein